jgi:outer membrane lipase/esterase
VANLDYSTYVFADRVYPTPVAQRLFGDYAYARLRARW